MRSPPRAISLFELASINLRNVLELFYRDLRMPPDTIKLQVEGILLSFLSQDAYQLMNNEPQKPEGPA
jgi:hypothetical protein